MRSGTAWLSIILASSFGMVTGCGDDDGGGADAEPEEIDAGDEEEIDAGDETPDAGDSNVNPTLADDEGGEVRIEYIQNNAGQTTTRVTAFFMESADPAHNPIPAFPGCVTEGDTMEELLRNLREAIQGCVGSRMDAAIAAALSEQPGDVITL